MYTYKRIHIGVCQFSSSSLSSSSCVLFWFRCYVYCFNKLGSTTTPRTYMLNFLILLNIVKTNCWWFSHEKVIDWQKSRVSTSFYSWVIEETVEHIIFWNVRYVVLQCQLQYIERCTGVSMTSLVHVDVIVSAIRDRSRSMRQSSIRRVFHPWQWILRVIQKVVAGLKHLLRPGCPYTEKVPAGHSTRALRKISVITLT